MVHQSTWIFRAGVVLAVGIAVVAIFQVAHWVGPFGIVSTHPGSSPRIVRTSPRYDGVKIEPSPATSFRFVECGEGMVINDVTIYLDGTVVYSSVFLGNGPNPQPNTKAKLAPEEVQAFCDVLNEIEFINLPDSYSTDVVCGTSIYCTLQIGTIRKEVKCDNLFPDEVMKITQFLEAKVLPKVQPPGLPLTGSTIL